MKAIVTLTKRLLTLALYLSLVLISFTVVILYLGYQWQPSSYKGNFAQIFSEPIYQKLISDLNKSDQSILQGEISDGFDYLLKTYITKCKTREKIKLRDPKLRENLEVNTNQYLSDIYDRIVQLIYQGEKTKNQKTSLWIIDVRNYNVTTQFLKSFQSLRKKYKEDRYIVITDLQQQVVIKGFKRYTYVAPTEQQIRSVIQQSQGNIHQVHISNLFWYYEDQINEIANIVDKYEVQTFHEQFSLELKQFEYIYEQQKQLLEGICDKGSYKSDLILQLRLSRIVGEKDGKYYWSSPGALLIYSGINEIECLKPDVYAPLTQDDRVRITLQIEQQIKEQEYRIQKQAQRIQLQRIKEYERKKQQIQNFRQKFNKSRIPKKPKKEKKGMKKTIQEIQQELMDYSIEPQEQVQSNKKQINKKKDYKQLKNKPSQKLQQRRSKKSIDYQQDEDEDRDQASDNQNNYQIDLLLQYADEDDEDNTYVGQQMIKRRIILAQKKTKKQQREQFQELQSKLKRIKSMRKDKKQRFTV